MVIDPRLSQRKGRNYHGFQLQQYRLGHIIWLDDLERVAITHGNGGRRGRYRFEYPYDLA